MSNLPWNVRFYCEREPWNFGSVAVFIRSVKNPNGDHPIPAIGLPLIFKEVTQDDEGRRMEPTMSMSAGDAQLLMDELWRIGLRPTEGTGSAGSLAATERHLQDMRSLVFKQEPKTVALGNLVGPHSP